MPMFRRFGRPGLIGLAARTAVVAGTATAINGGMRRRSERQAQEAAETQAYEAQQQQEQIDQAAAAAAAQAAPRAAAATDSGSNLIDELQKLSALHAQGGLNDEEYAAAKAKLLQ
ncbi:SHOCT domain-containing protein [Leucobacter viscericola]|uniref:SHOCT domain-containing protein n=1 Tax=Leucobacter viscericola TaxID=2714935 RepID=A0A6G7XIB3_9MICO|nr:SHOCT domain-containing protein [Leucobacter viscericola]QIK64179.1 SHOCT domain-containing protein [Leucobacter viscericola]